MGNQLAAAISPYLRSHADNPVAWRAWGTAPFDEAATRDVPVLVSIGYSTCHWCHVMARESFSDPDLAAYLNEHFVAIKVDREEHPEVDTSYLAAASAFSPSLGWPLNVFVTPNGKAFYAGTYFAPEPAAGRPSFRQVLEAVTDAWTNRRRQVEESAAQVGAALANLGRSDVVADLLPNAEAFDAVVGLLERAEDTVHGGFGGAPKFPMAPVLEFLLATRGPGFELASRTLRMMGASPLRDPVEGGFFRYAVNADWSEPHYERMLYDNGMLLQAYTTVSLDGPEAPQWAMSVVEGVAGFLLTVMQLGSGGFASAQDSESTVDGERVEGRYYLLDRQARAAQVSPALDEKILTGWNGLAIGALADAGFVFGRDDWVGAARRAADFVLAAHVRPDGTLVRASVDSEASTARATLEDYGMFAGGLVELARVTGEVRYAQAARTLVDTSLTAADGTTFGTPGGGDPVLERQGLTVRTDPSEGTHPSGQTAMARAAWRLYLMTADNRYRRAATKAMRASVVTAVKEPTSYGSSLALMVELETPQQLVIVTDDPTPQDDPLVSAARRHRSGLVAQVTESQARAFAEAGFELFDGRVTTDSRTTAYLCQEFACRLPITDPAGLNDPTASQD